MRIAVSGSHCSGKSTLIRDFLALHSDYAHEPEPYELAEALGEQFAGELDAGDFYRQLELSAERLRTYRHGERVIAERSPFDFLAYLLALTDLGRGRDASGYVDQARELVESTLEHIDLLVIVPLNDVDGIIAADEEDLELRDAMDERLSRLIIEDELGLLNGGRPMVIEVSGAPSVRLATLNGALGLACVYQV